jgi:hypothetical protein
MMDQACKISEEQIKQRAFDLWQQHGAPEGYQSEFWAQAERELKSTENTELTSPPPYYARSGSGSDCRY